MYLNPKHPFNCTVASFPVPSNMKLLIVVVGLATAVLGRPNDIQDPRRKALENPNLFEGDMVGVEFDAERNAVVGDHLRWTAGRIPYVIDSSLAEHSQSIRQAMRRVTKRTCISFIPRTDQENYIEIFKGEGCYSSVGMVGGKQQLSLGDGCLPMGTIMHQLVHALGFYHEHNRSDRDDYLEILFENVIKGQEHQFTKLSPKENILYTSFDYKSIMMLGNDAFSKDGSNTMISKEHHDLVPPNKKNDLTEMDKKRINRMYLCHITT